MRCDLHDNSERRSMGRGVKVVSVVAGTGAAVVFADVGGAVISSARRQKGKRAKPRRCASAG